jgi:hypothetical protein
MKAPQQRTPPEAFLGLPKYSWAKPARVVGVSESLGAAT